MFAELPSDEVAIGYAVNAAKLHALTAMRVDANVVFVQVVIGDWNDQRTWKKMKTSPGNYLEVQYFPTMGAITLAGKIIADIP